jgi:hypothetical protein
MCVSYVGLEGALRLDRGPPIGLQFLVGSLSGSSAAQTVQRDMQLFISGSKHK